MMVNLAFALLSYIEKSSTVSIEFLAISRFHSYSEKYPGEIMTMVDHGHHGFRWLLMVCHVSSWSTIKYHDKGIVLTMVDHCQKVDHCQPWSSMVDHGQTL